MEEQKAKWVFDQGASRKPWLCPPDGCRLPPPLVQFGKGAETSVLERQRGGWRVFKTIDAAVSTANGIGFRRIEVDLTSL
ncbi:plasmid replication protein RepB [Klebsiella michiganensis]|nr:plasmid replication protein RepB [Klebsiella michiganensis]